MTESEAAPRRLNVVDPHIHLWDRQAVRYPWLENAGVAFSGDNRLLPEPYRVSELLRDAADMTLAMSVHVEANPANALTEVRWLQNLRELERWGWSFDLQLYPSQIDDALAVIDANLGIIFILNHAGMFVDRNAPGGWRQWREGLRRIAERNNTAAKISGLAMFDHAWTLESLRPYVLETIDTFGGERCMFASNFPIDGLHAQYGQLWRAYAAIVADASEADRDALLSGNARRYYRLGAGA